MKAFFLFIIFIILLIAIGAALPSLASESPPLLTQRQWIIHLTEAMGWSFGLPPDPKDADYFNILDGRRHWRIEGEAVIQPTDPVSVKPYRAFGAYSGSGWLAGPAEAVTVHLRFLAPLNGTYHLSAALRRPGWQIQIGAQSFTADGGQKFTPVALGQVNLSAGQQEVTISFPPNGGFDYLQLDADDLPAIAPPRGWQPDQPLDLDTMAVTGIQLLGLEPLLPTATDAESISVEAETGEPDSAAQTTAGAYLGRPSGGRWLRAGTRPAAVRLNFSLPADGVYTLSLRTVSATPITATLNDRFRFTVPPSPYLHDHPLGSKFLAQGENSLRLELPPRAGVDCLRIRRQASQGSDYRRLVGLPTEGRYPTTAQANRLLALLAAIGAPR